jgi:prepilin-type N-terminal cleavage/methylation domain-containing protein
MRAGSRRRRSRAGFTLLEAAVALSIVGLAGVAALEAFGTELRTGDRARSALVRQALVEQKMAAISLTPASELNRLPDSLAAGRFDAPFEEARWTATVRRDRDLPNLFDVSVSVADASGELTVETQLYRPQTPLVRP